MERISIPKLRDPKTKHFVQSAISEREIGGTIINTRDDLVYPTRDARRQSMKALNQAACLKPDEKGQVYAKLFDPRISGSGKCLEVKCPMLTETHDAIKCIIFNAAENAERSA